MLSVVQPLQTVTVDGQEALFIPNVGNAQFAGAQVKTWETQNSRKI